MIDCVDAIAVPHEATAYVRPSASIFTIERGKIVLHVVRGRDAALRLIDEKRVQTRDERYALCRELIESSILPERADAPTVTVASTAAGRILAATFEVMPKLEALQSLVYAETWGLDAFVLPREAASGFGVIRGPSGPLLETFHSSRQAVAFLRRHELHISQAEMDEAAESFSYVPHVEDTPRVPEVLGGFAAAVPGAYYRFARMVERKIRGR